MMKFANRKKELKKAVGKLNQFFAVTKVGNQPVRIVFAVFGIYNPDDEATLNFED